MTDVTHAAFRQTLHFRADSTFDNPNRHTGPTRLPFGFQRTRQRSRSLPPSWTLCCCGPNVSDLNPLVRIDIPASLQAPPVTRKLLWVCQKAPRADIMPGPPTRSDVFRVHIAVGQAQVDLRRVSEVLLDELQRVPPKSLQDVWTTSSKRTIEKIGAGSLHEYQIVAALMTSGVSTVHACDSFIMSTRDAR
jgi:hypothetical protein